MATDPIERRPVEERVVVDSRGSRTTRLGLVTYGFVIGVIVTVIVDVVLRFMF